MKKFKVHITPKPKSHEDIMKPLLETLTICREEKVSGIIIGIAKAKQGKDSLVSYTNIVGKDCDTDHMFDLLAMIRAELMDWEQELNEGDYIDD